MSDCTVIVVGVVVALSLVLGVLSCPYHFRCAMSSCVRYSIGNSLVSSFGPSVIVFLRLCSIVGGMSSRMVAVGVSRAVSLSASWVVL